MGFSTLMGFSFFCFKPFQKPWFLWHMSWCSKMFQSLRQISTEHSHRLQTVRSLQPLRNLPTQMKSIRKIPQRNPQDFQSLRDWTQTWKNRRISRSLRFFSWWMDWMVFIQPGWLVDFYLYYIILPRINTWQYGATLHDTFPSPPFSTSISVRGATASWCACDSDSHGQAVWRGLPTRRP
jgi:hypothetical protein